MLDIKARVTSWKFILDSGVNHLPVDSYQLILNYQIPVATFEDYAKGIHQSLAYVHAKYSGGGFCLFDGKNYFVFYDAQLDERGRRWVLAHELAHIFLHHGNKKLKLASGASPLCEVPAEKEANKFALRLLCPSIVLHLCGTRSPEEVRRLCDVDDDIAALRWEHLQTLRAKKRFLVKDEERMVMNQFSDFICGYVADKLK